MSTSVSSSPRTAASELFSLASNSGPSSPASSTHDLDVKPTSTTSPSTKSHATSPSQANTGRCTALIFDLGDVLFTWSAVTKTVISPKTLHKILRSASWFEYEKGNIDEDTAYANAASEFGVPKSEVAAAFQGARDSLKSNEALVGLIQELRAANPALRVFAMSNISAPDWEVLRTKATPEEWAIFDRVFTSAAARERKPNLGFYRHVLEETGVDPLRTVFVDDKLENVLSARSLGLKGVVFDSFENVARQVRNYVEDPVGRAQAWLKSNEKKMLSVTDNGVVLHENFAPLLILEATGDRSLVEYVEHPRLFNFFQGGGVLTTADFPCDLDTTSIGLTVSTHVDEATKHSVMDEMLTYKNKDGIVQTYFDVTRPRIDPIVCTNVLTFFHMHSRGHELPETLDWVYSVLQHRAYLDGTLYYYGADTFLFFLSRLLAVSPTVYARFAPLFAHRVLERFGAEGNGPSPISTPGAPAPAVDAQALAMRIIAAATVGMCDVADYERLLATQEEDGSFPIGWVYKYGGSGLLIGNKGLTTALAVQAIKAVEALDREIR